MSGFLRKFEWSQISVENLLHWVLPWLNQAFWPPSATISSLVPLLQGCILGYVAVLVLKAKNLTLYQKRTRIDIVDPSFE